MQWILNVPAEFYGKPHTYPEGDAGAFRNLSDITEKKKLLRSSSIELSGQGTREWTVSDTEGELDRDIKSNVNPYVSSGRSFSWLNIHSPICYLPESRFQGNPNNLYVI